jgi:hypothetical protein
VAVADVAVVDVVVVDVAVDIVVEEEEDGGGKTWDIDIDHHQDLYHIVHGIGLEVHAKEDAQVLAMEIGDVNIRVRDQMIVGLRMIVMGVDIKILLYNINGL